MDWVLNKLSKTDFIRVPGQKLKLCPSSAYCSGVQGSRPIQHRAVLFPRIEFSCKLRSGLLQNTSTRSLLRRSTLVDMSLSPVYACDILMRTELLVTKFLVVEEISFKSRYQAILLSSKINFNIFTTLDFFYNGLIVLTRLFDLDYRVLKFIFTKVKPNINFTLQCYTSSSFSLSYPAQAGSTYKRYTQSQNLLYSFSRK